MQRFLESIPILLQTFVLTIFIWCFQKIFSSKYTLRNVVTNSLLIWTLSMCNGGKIFGIWFFFVKLNKAYFISEIFKERLLTLDQVATFLSSSFVASKKISILESEINKLASSANKIGVSWLELLERSFTYTRNKSGPII